MGTAFGDIDKNGKLDWFLTSMGLTVEDTDDSDQICNEISEICGNRLFMNNSPQPMDDVTTEAGVRIGGWGWGAAIFDFENDGDLDIAMTNGHATAPDTGRNGYFWENVNDFYVDGIIDGPLVDNTVERNFIDKYPYGLALLTLDFDRDGDLDIFISHAQDGGTLLRNDINNNNDWIKVKTIGNGAPETNHFGKGAQITVVLDNNHQFYQEMGIGSSFLGHSENNIAHFGLGSCPNGVVQYIEVWFPVTDTTVVFNEAPCNWMILIHEDGTKLVEAIPGTPGNTPSASTETIIFDDSDDDSSTLSNQTTISQISDDDNNDDDNNNNDDDSDDDETNNSNSSSSGSQLKNNFYFLFITFIISIIIFTVFLFSYSYLNKLVSYLIISFQGSLF